MTIPTTPADLAAVEVAIGEFIRDHGAYVLPGVFDIMVGTYWPSPVDRIVHYAEGLYAGLALVHSAHRDAAATLCYQLVEFCVLRGWQELGQTDRGAAIKDICLVEIGETPFGSFGTPDPTPLYAPEV